MEFKIKRFAKYRNLIIVYSIYVLFWIILTAVLNNRIAEIRNISLTRLIPINNLPIELALIFILILPLSGLLGLFIGGYLLSPIVMVLHKKLIGSKMYYGVQKKSVLRSEKIFTRGFFPILMAINLSSIFITPSIFNYVLEADIVTQSGGLMDLSSWISLLAESVLLIATFGISIFFFSSVWFLKDSGIIYSNRKKIENSQELFTIKSIGDWFQTILKSYAGIGAIITYILIVYNFVSTLIEYTGDPRVFMNIPSLILWLGLPFYLIVSLIPALICNDLIKNHRIKFIRNFGEKIGITHTAIISFELKGDTDISTDLS
ncbi:MAG: hypothetical protein ACFFDX_16250 [Candidatus Odinarchaeota archaeon]